GHADDRARDGLGRFDFEDPAADRPLHRLAQEQDIDGTEKWSHAASASRGASVAGNPGMVALGGRWFPDGSTSGATEGPPQMADGHHISPANQRLALIPELAPAEVVQSPP